MVQRSKLALQLRQNRLEKLLFYAVKMHGLWQRQSLIHRCSDILPLVKQHADYNNRSAHVLCGSTG